MSKPDKTLISIQKGKTTEEQVRFQYEKHLRNFIICPQLDPNTSKPGFGAAGSLSQSAKEAGCLGLAGGGEGSPAANSARGSAALIICSLRGFH